MPRIIIRNHDVKINIRKKKSIYKWLDSVSTKENKRISSLCIILCSDEFILEMNRKYLNHDFYTDVITFDLSESEKSIVGEIYISVDRVKENAKKFNQSITDELHRVIVHGLLHLCGYDDKTKNLQKVMRNKEDQYLSERNFLL